VGNAGCFLVDKQKLLVVQVIHNGRGLDIPGGTSEKGESAQCTAARETFEETGLNVIVHELAHTFGKFYLFPWRRLSPHTTKARGTLVEARF
jgi:8-oxo-dGTP pyrophosphatase MutT (NUDIX family)